MELLYLFFSYKIRHYQYPMHSFIANARVPLDPVGYGKTLSHHYV